MTTLIVQHKVNDYTAWKKVFDSSADLRTSHGELSAKIYRDATDPNTLTVINKWDSMENAKKFTDSPEMKAAMEKAGVAGQPNLYFLNEVEA